MKAVVLAAGRGKRLAAITVDKPKVLVRIGEKTLIEHNLDKLRRLGISNIALVIGYKGEMVKALLGETLTDYDKKEQLGTAHAFHCAKDPRRSLSAFARDRAQAPRLREKAGWHLIPPAIAVY